MARIPSPPRSSRATFEHPDRARIISLSRPRSPRPRSRSPDPYRSSSPREHHHRRRSSRDSYQGHELPTSPARTPRAMTGTNNTPLLPRSARSPGSARSSEGSSSQVKGASHSMPTSSGFIGPPPPTAASSTTNQTPAAAQSNAEKKRKKLTEYLRGPPDPPADVVVWTGVSARNQKHGANFYTGAYAIVWEKGNYRNDVYTFYGPGKSNVYAEFKAVTEVLQICRPSERVLIKTTSSEVINAIQIDMNTDFWEEVVNIRTTLRAMIKRRKGRVIFKKVPSRVGLPYNDRACTMADQARKKLENSGVGVQKRSAAPRKPSPPALPVRPEMPEVPRRMPMSEEKAQEFLEDFQAFLRAKALASLHTSTDVDEDGHRSKARKLSHPSQRDPRITGGQVTQPPPKQLSPRQVPGGVQDIIRPEQSAAAVPRSLSVVERSNDPAQQQQSQQEESDDEYFDAIDYWVDPAVKQKMDKAGDQEPKGASTLSWISNLADE